MRRLVTVLLGVALLAGCGVRPTPPVGGGDAPRGVAEGPTLYFLRGGSLVPVVRKLGKLGDYPTALRELFYGIAEDDPPGLTSALPTAGFGELTAGVTQRNTVEVRVLRGDGRPLTLSGPALDQIACTVSARHLAADRVYSVESVIVNEVPRRCPIGV
ncbi:hypothetical protein M8C13_26820 [Crossiella sp. SN42]|uniref:hypothetical protein n=1 Tax=Crossiella sp. SN42 TaxID=2944808 RepID=UPI00207D59F4|nr:hypothetical protein [Crossiella sp. SN42]MCO1579369.1 hypothetical protein [Crossiella sp. SN42]